VTHVISHAVVKSEDQRLRSQAHVILSVTS